MPKTMKGKTVIVEDGNVQKAIKKLRRRVIKEKILKQHNKHNNFTSKSYLRRKAKARKLFLSRLNKDIEQN